MAPRTFARTLLRRSLLLPAAGLGLAATAMRFYLTHPQRVIAELPADLAEGSQDVFLTAEDGARLHAVWLPGCGEARGEPFERTIVHYHGYNSSGGLVLARRLILPPTLVNPAVRRMAVRQLGAFIGQEAGTPHRLAAGPGGAGTRLQLPPGRRPFPRPIGGAVGFQRTPGR